MKTQSERQVQGGQVFSRSGNQCVWMKAGVVNFKTCENAFDCTSCAFDKAMSGQPAPLPTSPVRWREVMRQPQLHKECRHMLTGRVLFKLCSHNYGCQDCAYDQQLYEYDQLLEAEDRRAPVAPRVSRVAGFEVTLAENYCPI